MPHIVMEYSANLSEQVSSTKLLNALHQTVVDSGLFSPEAVKARSVAFSDYVLPEGADTFAHVTVAILNGRTIEQRQGLSEAVFARLQAALPKDAKLSVTIHEMEKETYKK